MQLAQVKEEATSMSVATAAGTMARTAPCWPMRSYVLFVPPVAGVAFGSN